MQTRRQRDGRESEMRDTFSKEFGYEVVSSMDFEGMRSFDKERLSAFTNSVKQYWIAHRQHAAWDALIVIIHARLKQVHKTLLLCSDGRSVVKVNDIYESIEPRISDSLPDFVDVPHLFFVDGMIDFGDTHTITTTEVKQQSREHDKQKHNAKHVNVNKNENKEQEPEQVYQSGTTNVKTDWSLQKGMTEVLCDTLHALSDDDLFLNEFKLLHELRSVNARMQSTGAQPCIRGTFLAQTLFHSETQNNHNGNKHKHKHKYKHNKEF